MLVRIGSDLSVSIMLLVVLLCHVAHSIAETTTVSITTSEGTASPAALEVTTQRIRRRQDDSMHDELSTLLKELRHVAEAIDSVKKEHTRISKGVNDISESVKEMSERSQHIQNKIHKLSKALNRSNHHHKFKDGLKALQKDHEHIIRAVTSLTLHHRSLKLAHRANKTKNHHRGSSIDGDHLFITNNETFIKNEDNEEIANEVPQTEKDIEVEKKSEVLPADCTEVIQMGNYTSGVYRVQPVGMETPIKVWCDQTTKGGGWTIFVARKPQETQQQFSLGWEDYKNGFGSPEGEHWLGNDALHLMTKGKRNEVRLNITNWQNESASADWKDFNVANEEDGYALTIGRYASGSTAGDALKWHNQMRFSTPDRDNDALMGGHCARKNDGGWWYKGYRGCYQAHPTGQYQKNPAPPIKTDNKKNFDLGPVLAWQNWRGETYFPKTLFLMFRPAP